jgi:hypothetical protein
VVSLSEHHKVLAEEKTDQAYYTARAAVEAANQWISTHFNARDDMENVIPDRDHLGDIRTISGILDGQDYTLSIWRDTADADLIHIKARATFEGFSATARMSLQETISGYALFEDAIYSKGPFAKSSGTSNIVYGSVATGAVSTPDDPQPPPNLNATGAKVSEKYYDFEDILPDAGIVFATYESNAVKGDGDYLNPTTGNLNAQYGILRISDNVYIKNTDDSGNPVDVHILVDYLYINEAAIVHPTDMKTGTNSGGGRVYIYVKDYIWCDKKFGVGVGDTGLDDIYPRTYLICSGTGEINFSGNPFMNLYLYGPDVNVEYGGTTVFNGAVIANVYGWNGNITVSYRPPDLEDSPFSNLNEAQKKVSIMYQTWHRN